MLTYGDGVGDINISKLLEFHKSHGRVATVTAVKPSAVDMQVESGQVNSFVEKPQSGEGWINGGFVFNPSVFEYLVDDSTVLEQAPLVNLAADGQLVTFQHEEC